MVDGKKKASRDEEDGEKPAQGSPIKSKLYYGLLGKELTNQKEKKGPPTTLPSTVPVTNNIIIIIIKKGPDQLRERERERKGSIEWRRSVGKPQQAGKRHRLFLKNTYH